MDGSSISQSEAMGTCLACVSLACAMFETRDLARGCAKSPRRRSPHTPKRNLAVGCVSSCAVFHCSCVSCHARLLEQTGFCQSNTPNIDALKHRDKLLSNTKRHEYNDQASVRAIRYASHQQTFRRQVFQDSPNREKQPKRTKNSKIASHDI